MISWTGTEYQYTTKLAHCQWCAYIKDRSCWSGSVFSSSRTAFKAKSQYLADE